MVMCTVIGSALPSVDWTDNGGTLTPSIPSHTFSGVDIGTAHSTRQVFVATFLGDVSAVTVGGVSASAVVSVADNSLRLWRAAVPTGTTASVVITLAGDTALIIQVWAAYNLRSTTPHDTASYPAGSTSTTHTTTINTADRGILIAAAGAAGPADVLVSSWTGATLRSNRRVVAVGVDLLESAADSTGTAAATGATLRSTWDSSVAARMVGATYR